LKNYILSFMHLPISLRSLQHRNFRLFFFGQALSLVGSWMQDIAEAWLVYKLTGSPLYLGLVRFIARIPMLMLTPLGGYLADNFDKRKVLVTTQTIMMGLSLCLAGLTLTNVVQIWHVLIIAFCMGIAGAMDSPTRQSYFIELVGKNDLINAIALNSAIFNGAKIVGPAIAGGLIASLGEGWCFLINGISFLAVIIGLILIKIKKKITKITTKDGILIGLKEGFSYALENRAIKALLLLTATSSIASVSYDVLMPVFAEKVIQCGSHGMGFLMGATGVGALCGAVFLATRTSSQGLDVIIARGADILGGCLIIFGLSTDISFSLLALVGVGFGLMANSACVNTLIQSLVHDEMRGRVIALYMMLWVGLMPIGSIIVGSLAELVGVQIIVIICGLIIIAGAWRFSLHMKEIESQVQETLIANSGSGF